MYSDHARAAALKALEEGASLSVVSRHSGISRSALRAWRDAGPGAATRGCPRCDGSALDERAYAALLGYYLGDGCVSRHVRYYALRVSCDTKYPGIIADVERVIRCVRPGRRTFRVRATGVIVVQSNWMHWPCVFPQHGPRRKHERTLGMKDWQWDIVKHHPADFLRGLFHSDGSRIKNWALQVVAGEKKRYEYPRWHFTNESAEIMRWCQGALDLLDIPWRQSSRRMLSVSRRDAVARLDGLIGLKE
jgi:hypothetical protein